MMQKVLIYRVSADLAFPSPKKCSMRMLKSGKGGETEVFGNVAKSILTQTRSYITKLPVKHLEGISCSFSCVKARSAPCGHLLPVREDASSSISASCLPSVSVNLYIYADFSLNLPHFLFVKIKEFDESAYLFTKFLKAFQT